MLRASYLGRRRRPSSKQTIFAAGMTGVAMTAGIVGMAGPANAASQGTWEQLSQCESSGDWQANTGNGFYGGLQFTNSTWDAFGGSEYAPRADLASKAEQIAVAERTLAAQGWDAWPACSEELGLSGSGDPNAQPVGGSSGDSEEHSEESSDSSASVSSSSSESSSGGSGEVYVVQSGDTLSGIANDVGSSWQSLYQANQDVVDNPDSIYPGDRLDVPA